LPITDNQLSLLERYVTLLLEWNKKINLISRKDEENVWQRHILHSISPLFSVAPPKNCRLIDLGSGGGLPGIPLKILDDSLRVVLLDATKKKMVAVEEMVRELNLSDTTVVWGRAEEIGRKEGFRAGFDVAVARGVGPLHELVHLAVPFMTSVQKQAIGNGGRPYLATPCLLAYKGGNLEAEIEKTRRTKQVKDVREIVLPDEREGGGWIDKKLVIVHLGSS
jgi:16S rRNA (guanine527-N7)-methyltransferase